MARPDLKITVKHADVCDVACDVLVLKYAQSWHGADLCVANELELGRGWSLGGDFVAVGDYKFVNTERKINANYALFEGVPVLRQFTYAIIREFSKRQLLHLHQELPNARHIAMPMHGVNFGMDERESFLSQLAGTLEALATDNLLPKLEELSFVEKNAGRAQRITKLLQDNYVPRQAKQAQIEMTQPVASAGTSAEKPHVFVAMPFSPEFEDVYIFGIQGPVQEAGLLCERVDMDVFTGDIVERIKTRIATAKFIIADLTASNANVYLEVGYAWGTKVTAVLLCKNVEELRFDVKGQRCIVYSSINDLKKKLTEELKVLLK